MVLRKGQKLGIFIKKIGQLEKLPKSRPKMQKVGKVGK
jgi:hypothetical protein